MVDDLMKGIEAMHEEMQNLMLLSGEFERYIDYYRQQYEFQRVLTDYAKTRPGEEQDVLRQGWGIGENTNSKFGIVYLRQAFAYRMLGNAEMFREHIAKARELLKDSYGQIAEGHVFANMATLYKDNNLGYIGLDAFKCAYQVFNRVNHKEYLTDIKERIDDLSQELEDKGLVDIILQDLNDTEIQVPTYLDRLIEASKNNFKSIYYDPRAT